MVEIVNKAQLRPARAGAGAWQHTSLAGAAVKFLSRVAGCRGSVLVPSHIKPN